MVDDMTSRTDRERKPSTGIGRGDGGFALVVTLLILVAVTLLAAGGLWAVRSETRLADNYDEASRAFQIADGALSQYLGSESGVPQPRSYTFADGTAQVTPVRLGVFAGGHELYRVTATGRFPSAGNDVERTVASMVLVDPLQLEFPGGLASGGNIRKDGVAGLISGFDAAASGDCPTAPQADRPGVIAEDYEQSGGGGGSSPGCDGPICGDPPIEETSDPLAGLTIDWQGILDGSVVDFDLTTSNPSSDWLDGTEDPWPVIFVDNDSEVSLSDAAGHSGEGILIIKGDVQFEGDFQWDGAILVGGSMKSAGNNQVYGATATGLNELIGGDPAETDLGNGEKTFQYHSCNLLRAMREAGKMYEVPGSWKEIR